MMTRGSAVRRAAEMGQAHSSSVLISGAMCDKSDDQGRAKGRTPPREDSKCAVSPTSSQIWRGSRKWACPIFATLALVISACSPQPPRLISRTHVAMGSTVALTAWTADERRAHDAFVAVFTEVDRLDALLSIWKPGSDVVRINAAAGRDAVTVSHETIDILVSAEQVSTWTRGKFDVTFAALAPLWKFDHDQDDRIPSPADVAARLPLIDYRDVIVDPVAKTVKLRREGMRVHLGGIGKGYAVDRAGEILRAFGLDHFLIQFGGDLYVAGRPGHAPWRLGVSDPRGPAGESFASLELTNATFSTSGDYERFFLEGGVRYHHILDPDTGQPARGCRSVTLVAKNAMLADALSTGVFIMGPTDGMALVERLPDIEGVIVSSSNDVLVSAGLRNKLRLLRPPTNVQP